MHRRLGWARGCSKEQYKINSGIATGVASPTYTTLHELTHPVARAIQVSHLELSVTLPCPHPRHIQTESYSYEYELIPESTTKYPPSSHDNMLRV